MHLDHAIVAVADLESASELYARLLGRAPSWRGTHPGLGTANVLFRLDNAYLELLAACGDGPLATLVAESLRGREERPFALALGVRDLEAAVDAARGRGLAIADPAAGSGVDAASGRRREWRSAFVDPVSLRGLRLLLIEHVSPPGELPAAPAAGDPAAAAAAIDHVVVFTEDLGASLALWQRARGLEERWRLDLPERGTRNVGLGLGDAVLELIQRTDREPSGRRDVLWGIAYRVPDCGRAVARARAVGLEVSDPRDGLAAGTRVANLRWARTATLLIAPAG